MPFTSAPPLVIDSPAVFFPAMRPLLAAADLRESVRFFDPGLEGETQAGSYRPEGLPLSPAEARGMLGQYESLGDGVKTPGDLATLRSMLQNDFFSETSHAIASDLADRMTPGRPEAARRRLVKAQTVLCLAVKLEERLVELGGLSDGLTKIWDNLGKTLGVEDDDEVRESVLPGSAFTPALAFEDDFRIPWVAVLEAMLAFLPQGTPLCLTDAAIVASWAERGLVLAKAAPDILCKAFAGGAVPAGTWLAGTFPGYSLALSNRSSEDKPWLDAPRAVLFRSPPEA